MIPELEYDEFYDLFWEDSPGDYRFVHKEYQFDSRWHSWHQVVFEYNGELFAFDFGQAATETQEDYMVSYGPPKIYKVIPEEKTITVYKEVSD